MSPSSGSCTNGRVYTFDCIQSPCWVERRVGQEGVSGECREEGSIGEGRGPVTFPEAQGTRTGSFRVGAAFPHSGSA